MIGGWAISIPGPIPTRCRSGRNFWNTPSIFPVGQIIPSAPAVGPRTGISSSPASWTTPVFTTTPVPPLLSISHRPPPAPRRFTSRIYPRITRGQSSVAVNGTALAGSSGYSPAYIGSGNESDASIREGIHGIFSDNRINFAASLLQAGQNTITIGLRQTGKVNGDGYFADHAMYDYVRLELTGYISRPRPAAAVTAYPGNSEQILICWPVQPNATQL